MDRALHDTILSVATDTRMWVQAKADQSGYNPEDLRGWCAIAAAELQKRLKALKIKADICMYEGSCGHCYCIVEDHVVDITATQFYECSNEPVVIRHCKEAFSLYFYQGERMFRNAKALLKYQKANAWPASQLAYA